MTVTIPRLGAADHPPVPTVPPSVMPPAPTTPAPVTAPPSVAAPASKTTTASWKAGKPAGKTKKPAVAKKKTTPKAKPRMRRAAAPPVARVAAIVKAAPHRKLLQRPAPYVVMASMGQLLGSSVPASELAERRRADRADRRTDFRRLFGALAVLMVVVLGASIAIGTVLQWMLSYALD